MASKKKLKLAKSDKWLGGVCGGLGDYFDTDPLLFRILFILLTVFSGGAWLIAYLLLWILMPGK